MSVRRSKSPEQENRKRKRELLVSLLAALFLAMLIFVQAEVSKSPEEFPYGGHLLVFALLSVVTLLLILIIYFLIRNFFKLVFERRRKVLGSHLKTRLTLAFVALTLVPTTVLFIAGIGILHTTIESWFKTQVEESLQSSLVVAQAYYSNTSDKVLVAATRISQMISAVASTNPDDRVQLARILEKKQSEEGLSFLQVYFQDGSPPILIRDPALKDIAIPPPLPSFLKIGFQGEKTGKIIPLDSGGDLVSGIVPIKDRGVNINAVLIADSYIPNSLAGRLFSIAGAFGDYQEAKRMRGPLKTIYVLILLIIALLIIFIGFWFGMSMARDITDPILELSDGTQKIAAGDLDVFIEPSADDELGVLVQSFNKMTEDLRRSRDELVKVNVDLESRRKYTETVLKSIAAGVISIDSNGHVTTVNSSGRKLLGITHNSPGGKKLSEVLPEPSQDVIKECLAELHQSQGAIEKQLAISFPEGTKTLLCFANILTDDENRTLGEVLVFEDMSHLVKAQRMAAWREVARRIAHEIKNPLTPIQLNAQRIRRKYLEILKPDSEVLDQCTRAIVDQVEQLKNMVNEFSKFARMPAANLTPNDLNALIKEVADLYEYDGRASFQFNPDPTIPVFNLDKEQIKRAVVNLVDNAISAVGANGYIEISTSYHPQVSIASVEVSDNGPGVSPHDRERLFEPYYSKKPGGTGLGLTITATIVSDHNGFIRVKDNPGGGAKFIIELPVKC